MAKVTKDDVLSYLESANMLEISELISDIEEKFGVSAAAPVAVAGVAAPADGGADLISEFVVLFVVVVDSDPDWYVVSVVDSYPPSIAVLDPLTLVCVVSPHAFGPPSKDIDIINILIK